MVVAMLAAIVALPVLAVVVSALEPRGELWRHLLETRLASLSWNTLRLLVGVAIGAGTLGVGLGWLVAVHRFPGRGFFEWALVLPLAMPAYVYGFVMIAVFDFTGALQTWMRATFGAGAGLPDIRSYGGVVLVMSLVFYPYVFLLARAAFAQRGAVLVETAKSLGQSPRSAFWRLALPLARPAIAAGVTLALMEALTDFGTVSVFAYDTFTTAIYRVWFGMLDRTGAGQIALVLMLFAALLVWGERRARGRAAYTVVDGGRPRPISTSRGRGWIATAACAAVLGVSFVLPVSVLVRWSIESIESGRVAHTYPTLVRNTLVVAIASAVLTVLAALVLAYASRRARGGRGQALSSIALLGYAVPGSVVAVGVLLVMTQLERGLLAASRAIVGVEPATLLASSIGALLFAYLVRFVAVAYYPVHAGLARIPSSMDESARALGAGPMRVLSEVHAPLLRGSLLAAAILVVIETLKELPATMLIRPFGFETLAVEVWQRTNDSMWVEAAPPSLAIVAVGACLVAGLDRTGMLRGERA
jgi:iron(III) transport system permease protein